MIASVCDEAFAPYGDVLEGYDTQELCRRLQRRATGEGVRYQASLPELEALPLRTALEDRAFGGMPIQIGVCEGRNTRLNCLEYHQCSEINIGADDFILLVARREEIRNGRLDTGKVRAFRVPAGMAVRLYATTLHYAPCHQRGEAGFCVAIVLPRGTNAEKPAICPETLEDRWLWGRNKWLLAHPDSEEAAQGAYVGLDGINWDVREMG